jgi:peptidoglycan/LPS O-acetylase OafA/YrhL
MTENQTNNFDLLRFVLASMVFLVHVHVLSGAQELAFLSRYVSADLAVKSFFVVSGFLIFRSFEASRSVTDYFEKRARRIYPAYACVILVSALIGLVVTQLRWSDYLSMPLLKYLAANLVFLNFLAPKLPGVFAGNPFEAVNGALWTLKIEVAFYLLVPLIAMLFRRFGFVRVLAVLYVMSVIYLLVFEIMAQRTGRPVFDMLAMQLPGQLTYFLIGGAFHYRESLLSRRTWPIVILSGLWLVFGSGPLDAILAPICLGFVVVYFAMGIPSLGNFGRYGDLSYGIYIIHFPVLQFLVWKGFFARSPEIAFFAAIVVINLLAWGSWHLVEKRWLRKSSHYVLSTGQAS